MRKSFTRRPSLSGAPLRVRHDHEPSSTGRHSTAQASQRPRSMCTGRGLTSGRPSSGIGVRGRTDVPKDTRPISDKRYQSQCISNLLQFLTSNKYPHPISHKLLSSPSSKDFFAMFEFIMGHFWEDYKSESKNMQEVVPGTLKLLGYPFNLPKSYLSSVGSQHTWPHLLAALTWLIELLQIQSSIGGVIDGLMFESADDDFDGIPDDKISFDYRERTFMAFMGGADTFEEENIALEKALMEKYHEGNIQEIMEENKRLEALSDDREKMEEKISRLKERSKCQNQDEKLLRDYLEQMQRHKQTLVSEFEKKQEESAIIKSDLQREESRLGELQSMYERQELKPADVERLKAEREQLNTWVDQLEKQVADINADIWQVNMEQARQNEKLQEEVAKYNRLAISLKLVPESAEFADGKDFRLHAGCSSDLIMDFHTVVKPMLALLKKNLSEQFRSKKKEQFSLICDTEKMQEMLNDKKEKLVQKEKELAQIEAEIETLKQNVNTEQKSVSEELGALEQDVVKLEANFNQLKAEKDRLVEKYAADQKSFHSLKDEAQRKVSEIREAKEKMTERLFDHTENVKRQLDVILRQVEAAAAEESEQQVLVQETVEKTLKKFGLTMESQ